MSEPSTPERIAAFLAEPVPGSTSTPGHQQEWYRNWHERAAGFGPDAPALFMKALAEGNQNAQYGALLALRHYGFEAWCEGFGDDEVYKVRRIGETKWSYIKPRIKLSDDPGVVVTAVKPPENTDL